MNNEDYRVWDKINKVYVELTNTVPFDITKPNDEFEFEGYMNVKCKNTGKRIYEGDVCRIKGEEFIVGINPEDGSTYKLGNKGVKLMTKDDKAYAILVGNFNTKERY